MSKADITREEYFQVYALSREVDAFDNSIMTKAGIKLWLEVQDGYNQLVTGDFGPYAHKFKERPTLKEVAAWDGKPWYHRMEPGSARVLHTIIETTKTTAIDGNTAVVTSIETVTIEDTPLEQDS